MSPASPLPARARPYDERAPTGRGYALFAVLVAVLLVMAAGALLMTHAVRRMALLTDQYRDLHVQALVDSGVSLALAQIRQDYGYEGSSTASLDGGRVVIQITRTSLQLRQVALRSFYRGESRSAQVTVFVETPASLPEIRSFVLVPNPGGSGPGGSGPGGGGPGDSDDGGPKGPGDEPDGIRDQF